MAKKENPPQWALDMIDQLRQLEIHLGNVQESADWQSDYLDKIQNKRPALEGNSPITEHHTELLFTRIAKGLEKEGWTPEDSSDLINEGMKIKQGPSYCNSEEVIQAIKG